MAGRVTLADVAKAAGVDVSLVSRVLRGEEVKVRDETKDRIIEHARRLDYRPNAIARSLKSSRAGAFGLVIPTFNNPVYAQIIIGAEAAAAKLGSVMLTTSGEGWDRTNWLEALDGGRVDGLLIAGGSGLEHAQLRVPYLMVNRAVPGIDRYVVLDDEKASRMAVEHLAGLGHRRIAFLGGPAGADTAERRRAGFDLACRELDLIQVGDPVSGDYTADGGGRAMRTLIGARLGFTAVVAANLPSAVGGLRALEESGISVPGAVSLIAIHDAEIAGLVKPGLTTVQMPLTQLGARAIELLSTRSSTARITEVVDRPMRLVERESTGPAAQPGS
jgi:LacI family transcriptional regulator